MADGTADFPNDPLALSRIYTTPYLFFEVELALVLEEVATKRVVGYCLAALDAMAFYARYETNLRPSYASEFPLDAPSTTLWTDREREIHAAYHSPDYFIPGSQHPAQLHIDLLPEAQRQGFGRLLVRLQLAQLAQRGSRGVHLGLAACNTGALAFYHELGFNELSRENGTIYMGRALAAPPTPGPPPVLGNTNVASYLAGPGAALACGSAVLGASWVAVTQPDPWAIAEVSAACIHL